MITPPDCKGPDEEMIEGDTFVSLPVLLWMDLLLMNLLLWSWCCGLAGVDAGPVYICKTGFYSGGCALSAMLNSLQLEFQTRSPKAETTHMGSIAQRPRFAFDRGSIGVNNS